MTANLTQTLLRLFLLGLLLSFALGLNYLSAWTNLSAAPTVPNAAAPLNVSTTAQVKDGNLSIGNSANTTSNIGLSVIGSQYIDGWLKVGDGASGAATQPLELVGTAGTHGIKFPDGTTQTSAASGMQTSVSDFTVTGTLNVGTLQLGTTRVYLCPLVAPAGNRTSTCSGQLTTATSCTTVTTNQSTGNTSTSNPSCSPTNIYIN